MRAPDLRHVTGLVVACAVAAGPATAQQSPRTGDRCTLQVFPPELHAGLSAVETTTRFSESIGGVADVVVDDGAGIELASRERLRRLFAASTGEEGSPDPVRVGSDGRSATLWLDLLHATPGTHQIVVRGPRRSCLGTLYVR